MVIPDAFSNFRHMIFLNNGLKDPLVLREFKSSTQFNPNDSSQSKEMSVKTSLSVKKTYVAVHRCKRVEYCLNI